MEHHQTLEVVADAEADANTPLLASNHADSLKHLERQEPEWPGQADFEGLPWWKTPSIFCLLPPFLLFTLAFGGIVVPKLNLIKELICRDYLADRMAIDPTFSPMPINFGKMNDQCRIPEVQSRATQFMLVGTVIAGLLSALTSPKLGALSDRYGRLPIMVFTSLGPLTGEIITIIAASHPDTFAVHWLYVGFVLDGLSGSFISGMALSHAYATDCTPPNRRNVAFGYFHGVLFTGIAIGPLIAGFVVQMTGSLLSIFYVALAFHLFFLSCLIFVIPESLTKARQKVAREQHKKLWADFRSLPENIKWFAEIRSFNPLEPLKVLYPTGPGSSSALRRNLLLLSAVDTVMFGVAMGAMTVVIYYTDYQFGWGTPEQSYFMSIVNVCRVLGLFVVLPSITRLVRGKLTSRRPQRQTGCDRLDLNIIRVAVFFDMLGYLGYTLVRSGGLFILAGCIASIGGIGSPTLQSSMTKHVPHDRVGQLLGANGLLHALARVVSPAVFNGIYSVTVGKYTQAVFLCLTVGFAVATVLSWFLRAGVHLYIADELRPSSDGAAQEERRED